MNQMPSCPKCGSPRLKFLTRTSYEPHGERFTEDGAHCWDCGGEFLEVDLVWPDEPQQKPEAYQGDDLAVLLARR